MACPTWIANRWWTRTRSWARLAPSSILHSFCQCPQAQASHTPASEDLAWSSGTKLNSYQESPGRSLWAHSSLPTRCCVSTTSLNPYSYCQHRQAASSTSAGTVGSASCDGATGRLPVLGHQETISGEGKALHFLPQPGGPSFLSKS